MDPKNLSGLDPKLKEAYERVMGTPLPNPQTPSPQPPSTPPTGGPTPVQSDQPPSEPAIPPAPASEPNPEPNPPQPFPNLPEPPPVAQPTVEATPAPPPPSLSPTEPVSFSSNEFVQQPAKAPQQEQEQKTMHSELPLTAAVSKGTTHVVSGYVAPGASKSKGSFGLKLSTPILLVVGVAFLILYALVWIRIFNLSLPF